MTDQEILREIESIRAKNNEVWMTIMKLALTAAPVSTKVLLGQITENDQKVSLLMQKLVDQ